MAVDPRFYTSQATPSAVPGAPGAPLLNAGSQALAQASRAFDKTGQLIIEDDNRRALTDAHTAVAQGLEDVTSHLNDMKTSPDWGGDPTGFTPEFHSFVNDYGTKLIEAQTNPRAKAFVADTFGRMAMAQVREADNWERGQQVAYQGDQIKKQTDAYTKVVAADPSQYSDIQQTLHDSIDNAKLTPDIRIRLKDGVTKQLAMAANQSYIANDPHGAYADYQAALGLTPTLPTLPTPTPTPGSSAPALNSPTAETGADVSIGGVSLDASLEHALPKNWPGGVDPQLDAAIASMKDPKRLALLQKEKAAQQAQYAQWQKDGTPTAPPAAPAPATVASSGQTTTDAGPGYTMPLDPNMPAGKTAPVGKPYIDSLTTPELVQLSNEAHARMLNGQAGARAELARQMDNQKQAAEAGMDTAPIPRSAFDAAYPGDKGTADAQFAVAQSWQNMAQDVKTISKMPNGGIPDYVESIKPKDTTAPDFYAQMERWKATAAAGVHIVAARNEDGIAALTRQGLYQANQIDLNTPGAFEAELLKRQQQTSTAQGVYLTSPIVFAKPEAKALASVMQNAPFSQQANLLASLRRGLPDDATYMAALQQIHPDAPEIAAAGAVAAFKPGYDLATGFPTTAGATELMLQGAAILHASEQQKKVDGVGLTPVMPDAKQLQSQFGDAVGDAYAGRPGALRTDFQTFREVYAAIAAKNGVVVGDDKTPDDKILKEAINVTTGGMYDVGGDHKIMKPYGMPDDVFSARYAEAYDTALARAGLRDPGHSSIDKYPPSQYPPINSGNGTYYLRSGAGYLRSPINGEAIQVEVPTGAYTRVLGSGVTQAAPVYSGGGRQVSGRISEAPTP